MTSWQVLMSAARAAKRNRVPDLAAAMTYFTVLALFPAIIVMLSLIGLVEDPQTVAREVLDVIDELAPGLTEVLRGPVTELAGQPGTASALLSFGLLAAVWSASGYVGVFIRAMNTVHGVTESRPVWKLWPLRLLLTVAGLVAVAALGLGLVLTGPVAESIGGRFGVSELALTIWDTAKWPVMVVVAAVLLAGLYWAAPDIPDRRWRWLTPGALIALVVWVLASGGFGFYVANFGSYNRAYGSLGAVVIFLVWLWITNLAILAGAEIDASLARVRRRYAAPDEPPADPPAETPDQAPAEGSDSATLAESPMPADHPGSTVPNSRPN